MVHGREQEGQVDRFGVSGYTRHNTFLMFDRRSESLWYPFGDGKWTAISGPRQGEQIEFYDKPKPVSLGEWRKRHPETTVLLGSMARLEARESEGR